MASGIGNATANQAEAGSSESNRLIDPLWGLNASLRSQLFAEPEYRMSEQLHKYLTPVLITVGNFSNLLALLVLHRKNFRRHSACFYMCGYAVSNLLVLNLVSGLGWLSYILHKPYVTMLSDVWCGLWMFLTNVMVYSGIWFVVAMTVDRYIQLCYPRQALTVCTLFVAKLSVVFIMIGLVVISVHAMWTFQLQPQGCFIPYYLNDLYIRIWPWMSATFYVYLPLLMLFVLNILLSVALCLKRHRSPEQDQAEGSDNFIIITLIVSSSYFILTVPATILNLLDIHAPSSWLNPKLVAQIELTKKVTDFLMGANPAILGYILLCCCPMFRNELKQLFTDLSMKRRPKVYEMRKTARDEDSSHIHVEYEACNDGNNAACTSTL